jgi:hypothetical protein
MRSKHIATPAMIRAYLDKSIYPIWELEADNGVTLTSNERSSLNSNGAIYISQIPLNETPSNKLSEKSNCAIYISQIPLNQSIEPDRQTNPPSTFMSVTTESDQVSSRVVKRNGTNYVKINSKPYIVRFIHTTEFSKRVNIL